MDTFLDIDTGVRDPKGVCTLCCNSLGNSNSIGISKFLSSLRQKLSTVVGGALCSVTMRFCGVNRDMGRRITNSICYCFNDAAWG